MLVAIYQGVVVAMDAAAVVTGEFGLSYKWCFLCVQTVVVFVRCFEMLPYVKAIGEPL